MAAKKKTAKKIATKKTRKQAATGLDKPFAALRKIALSFPETREDFPWGHSAFKVGAKAFVFMSLEGGQLGLSVKLPRSGPFALMQPYAQPTGYGLGKSGWVSASFTSAKAVPVDLMREWIEESFLAIAPRKIAARVRTTRA